MKPSELTKKIEELGIKQGDAIEVTVHVNSEIDTSEIYDFDYKSMGYFQEVLKAKEPAREFKYRGSKLVIHHFKPLEIKVPYWSGDVIGSFDIQEIRKLD